MRRNSWLRLIRALYLAAAAAWGESFHLKDGSVLHGDLVKSEDSVAVIRTPDLGEVRVPKTALAENLPTAEPPASENDKQETESNRDDLVLMPTAFTPPAGSWSFEDFELFFLTLSYSPTSSTAVTLGALFPIDPGDIEVYTLGFKQRLYQTPKQNFALAVTGDISALAGSASDDVPTIWTANLVASYAFRDPETETTFGGFHIAAGEAGSWQNSDAGSTQAHHDLSLAAGANLRITPHSEFLAEYLWGGEFLGTTQNESILNFGLRIHGQRLSADICGFRVLSEDMGNIFLLPMLKIGYNF